VGERLGVGGVSTPRLLCRISIPHRVKAGHIGGAQETTLTYPLRIVKPLWNVETQYFNGNLSTLELALVHRVWTLVLFHFRAIVAEAL